MFFSVRKLNIYTFRFEQGRGRKRNKNAFYLMELRKGWVSWLVASRLSPFPFIFLQKQLRKGAESRRLYNTHASKDSQAQVGDSGLLGSGLFYWYRDTFSFCQCGVYYFWSNENLSKGIFSFYSTVAKTEYFEWWFFMFYCSSLFVLCIRENMQVCVCVCLCVCLCVCVCICMYSVNLVLLFFFTYIPFYSNNVEFLLGRFRGYEEELWPLWNDKDTESEKWTVRGAVWDDFWYMWK